MHIKKTRISYLVTTNSPLKFPDLEFFFKE